MSHHLEKRLDSLCVLAEGWGMRISSVSAAGWLQPARMAKREPSGLTARRFVDLGRTESMTCPLHAY
jgi:hypothetical protein